MSESPDPAPRIHVDILVDVPYVTAVDIDDIERAVVETLLHSGTHAAKVVLTITDDDTVRSLNSEFRNMDAATDVLSFPGRDGTAQEEHAFVLPPDIAADEQAYLGDIVIALPYTQRQAQHFGNSIDSELRLLAVHGVLHLLGFDHDTPQAESAMWEIQNDILAKLGDAGLGDRTYDD